MERKVFGRVGGGVAVCGAEFIRGKDPRTLARGLLAMSQEDFGAAFKGSPIKRAKLRGVKRNAAVVVGNVGTRSDVDVLTPAVDAPDAMVREHVLWALAQVISRREDMDD